MIWLFIHPERDGPVSGGHVYNQAMLRAAARAGFPLLAVPIPPQAATLPELPAKPAGLLWDSLCLPLLASQPVYRADVRQGLLMHWLPWADPLLTGPEQSRLRGQFDHATRNIGFFLATGASVAAHLAALLPDRPVWLCEPGVAAVFGASRPQCRNPSPSGRVRIITVANLLPAKRPVELLDLLARIDAPWEWHLAGATGLDPAGTARLQARVQKLGLEGRVTLHGELGAAALARLMGRMDLLASFSAHEAYGMALAEGVACGLPVVATAVGAADTLVQADVTGLLVPWDDAEGFRRALERLIRSADLRRQFARAAARRPPRRWPAAFADFAQALDQAARLMLPS